MHGMTNCRPQHFYVKISRSCLVVSLGLCGFYSSPARGDRILNLEFWTAERSELALGGLWEFHAQTLLEPEARLFGSDLLLEISQPWRHFQPLADHDPRPLQRGSYVLLLKGLEPRALGYAIQIASVHSMTRVIASPKYAPERSQRVQTEGFFKIFPQLGQFLAPPLKLLFSPGAVDEVWMIIVQRWQTTQDAVGSIPRLQFAKKE